MNAPKIGQRRVCPIALASELDAPTRSVRRYLKAHYPTRVQADGAFALTEFEHLEARQALRKFSAVYVTGFSPEKRRR